MTFSLSQKSKSKLVGVDPKLVKVVQRAIELTEVDFAVLEGLRDKERQAKLVAEGKSQTMNSKHLKGWAVDLGAYVNGTISWDKEHYFKIAKAMKQAASELKVTIRWGGEFKSFFDGPHFELI
jgi:peptidoglycan L-alanyl-D-glutamate endopeptidase CwlK